MTHTRSQLYYHLVWATWDREPVLVGDVELSAYALIRAQCTKMNCKVIELGGIEEHVHLLVSMPRTLCLSDLAESLKGVSSRGLNDAYESNIWSFRWQRGYGVQTVSPGDVARVTRYIKNQKEHHASSSLWPAAERTADE